MIKAIIFDCFGVVITDGFDDAYRRAGGDPDLDRGFITDAMYKSDSGEIPTSLPLIANRLGISEHAWHEIVNNGRIINYELLEYVNLLKKKYRTVMLSNIGSAGVRRFFPEGLLEKHFDQIIESGVIGFAKPEARAYEIAADAVGVRLDECVFTDDRPEYIEGAQHVGMQTILFENFEKFKIELEKIL
jgi:putative hydrolase of the HAD superfamily